MLCGSQGGSTHLDFSNLLVIGKYYIFVMHQLVILGRYVIFKSLLILIPKKHVSASLGKMWFSHIDLGRANQNNRPNNISWGFLFINFYYFENIGSKKMTGYHNFNIRIHLRQIWWSGSMEDDVILLHVSIFQTIFFSYFFLGKKHKKLCICTHELTPRAGGGVGGRGGTCPPIFWGSI